MLVADLALLGDLEARRRGDAGQPGMPTATPRFRSHEQPHRLDLSEDAPANRLPPIGGASSPVEPGRRSVLGGTTEDEMSLNHAGCEALV